MTLYVLKSQSAKDLAKGVELQIAAICGLNSLCGNVAPQTDDDYHCFRYKSHPPLKLELQSLHQRISFISRGFFSAMLVFMDTNLHPLRT